MTQTITPVSKMWTLVKREFQENRVLFLYVPVSVVVLTTVAFTLNAFRSYAGNLRFVGLLGNRQVSESRAEVAAALQEFSELSIDIKMRFWEQFYGQTLPLLYVCFWGVMIYYCQMSLFSQRRDRSILFWNSFPIRNSETILSKLFAGFLLCHGIYVLCVMALQVIMLMIMMGYGAMFGMDLWSDFVAPAGILPRFGRMVIYTLLAVFWCLPMYAWFMLTSAWSKSAPFAWSMAPLVIIVVLEMLILDSADSVGLFLSHVFPVDNLGISPATSYSVWRTVYSVEMLLSILVGGALVWAAIYLNRSEEN